MPESRSYSYCWTINNPGQEDEDALAALEKDPIVRYLLFGREKGEQEETPHLQGYVYFHNKKTFSTLKKLLPRAHIEACKGSPEQNIAYCKKEGDFYESGSPPMSKKRKGELGAEYWAEQLSLAKKGRVEDCDPKLQITHDLALHRIAARYAPKPEDLDTPNRHHQWFYGPTGTGKSRTARDRYPNFYDKSLNKWWDGYNGETAVLLDDFGKDHVHLGSFLKRWADRYSFPAEIKGSKLNIRPNIIIVTSNYHPAEIWQDPSILGPIERRFHISHFNSELSRSDT